MKKLNLNEPGGRLCAWGMGLLAAAGALWAVARLGGVRGLLLASAAVLAVLGAVLLLTLALLVAVELRQDAAALRRLVEARQIKIPLPGGGYECQYCGGRMSEADTRRCGCCAKTIK